MYEQQTEGKAIAMLAIVGLVGVMSIHSLLFNSSPGSEQPNNPYQVTAVIPQ